MIIQSKKYRSKTNNSSYEKSQHVVPLGIYLKTSILHNALCDMDATGVIVLNSIPLMTRLWAELTQATRALFTRHSPNTNAAWIFDGGTMSTIIVMKLVAYVTTLPESVNLRDGSAVDEEITLILHAFESFRPKKVSHLFHSTLR